MNRFLRAAALVAASVLLVPAPPALAEDIGWLPAPCATGAITDYSGYLDPTGVPVVSVGGWIQPCAETVLTTGFGIAAYFRDKAILVTKKGAMVGGVLVVPPPVRPYRSRTAPTGFLSRLDTTPSGTLPGREELGPLLVICLAYDRLGRVACVGVQHGGPDGVPIVAPIATDDPAVRWFILDEKHPPSPGCGTCL